MKQNNKDDDAALVDSFFLPGGLFADENSNNHHGGRAITNDSYAMRIGSIPTPAANSKSPISSPLPKNPWETNANTNSNSNSNSNSNNSTIEARAMDTGNAISTGMNQPYIQPLHLPYSSGNNHEYAMDTVRHGTNNYNGIIDSNRSSLYVPYLNGNETGTASVDNIALQQTQNETFPNRNKYQESSDEGGITNRISDTDLRLRPPPGFQNLATSAPSPETTLIGLSGNQNNDATFFNNFSHPNSRDFLKSNNATAGNTYSWGESTGTRRDDHWESIDDPNNNNNNNAPFLMKNVYPTANNTLLSHQHQTSRKPSKNNNYTLPRSDTRKAQTTPSVADQHRNYEQNGQMRNERKPFLSKHISATPNIAIESNAILIEPNRSVEEDYCDDDEVEVEDLLHEDELEDNSIPSNTCGSSGIESNTSSLSTFSEADNNSDLSFPISSDIHLGNSIDLKDEGIGYDTDEAHVSRIVGLLENSTCSAAGQGSIPVTEQSFHPDRSNLYSEGKTRKAPLVSEASHRHSPNDIKAFSMWQTLLSILRSIAEWTARRYRGLINPAIRAMQRSSFFSKARQHRQRVSQQMKQLSKEFRNLIAWLIEIEEVFAVLLLRLVNAIGRVFLEIMRALVMLFCFLFQMIKFGLIEAIEEFEGVTTCYAVFYLLPPTCVRLMDFINLPHWTPHIVTWMSIYSLCYLVKAGTLHETSDGSMLSLLGGISKTSSSRDATDSSNEVSLESSSTLTTIQRDPIPHRKKRIEEYNTWDEHICYICLKLLKMLVPVLFLAEGFSSDFGTIVGAKSTSRLITAYNMIIVRKCLVKFPIAWISWAIQVLTATYCDSSLFLDFLILLTGLSSIRLMRYVDAHRRQGNQGTKTKKLH